MKKMLFSIASLMFLIAGNAKAENYRTFDYQAASVSTVSYSSAPVQAFLGEGIILAVGCSSSSVNSFWDIYDTTAALTPTLVATDTSGLYGKTSRFQNYQNQYSTSQVAAGEVQVYPQRVENGCYWLFSDRTANQAWIKYIKLR